MSAPALPYAFAKAHGILVAAQGADRAQLLLREGADPDQRDLLNRSPREIALMRGYVDVAAELALPGNAPQAPVSMARFLREYRNPPGQARVGLP